MKYYRIRSFNKDGKYCGHFNIRTALPIEAVMPLFRPTDRYDEITEEEYRRDKLYSRAEEVK